MKPSHYCFNMYLIDIVICFCTCFHITDVLCLCHLCECHGNQLDYMLAGWPAGLCCKGWLVLTEDHICYLLVVSLHQMRHAVVMKCYINMGHMIHTTCVHTHMRACRHVHTHTCTHTCVDTYTHAHIHVWTHTYTHTHTRTHTHTHTHEHTHIHTHTNTHEHTHTHARTHTHTHTCSILFSHFVTLSNDFWLVISNTNKIPYRQHNYHYALSQHLLPGH